ncbi:hypothetical protein [Emticicia sp. TH156]|uniref:hypothetical protein n=1 Tax=Emticicia sp. TH156 TaxID=2067454 RepID=UPI000C782485|nr:hypothetical protein [Emticicia sp. TH156]PLK44198.1 hypothetical protein C0V77_10370 [Emticicia sp. TH156]
MKIILTNWINIVGVFVAVFLYSVIYGLTNDDGVSRNFLQAILASIILIALYGIILWIGFIVALVALDFLLIVFNEKHLKLKLVAEWFIISSPFIYCAIIYEQQRWIYLVAVAAFLISQLLRQKLIIKVIG